MMKRFFLITIVLFLSILGKSQNPLRSNKGNYEIILNCINTNPSLREKYKIKEIITYRSEHKSSNYKKEDHYTIYNFIDSNSSVISKTYLKGNIVSGTNYLFNSNNHISIFQWLPLWSGLSFAELTGKHLYIPLVF